MRILLLVVLIATLFVAAMADIPDFKKMKIKEIKAWMQEYGLACSDCSDKDSLVQFCIKNAKATPKAVRPKVPAGKTFWDAWADNAKEICDAQVAKTGAGEEGAKVCDAIRLATDSFFLQKGKQVAGKLKKKPEALLKTSYSEIYYDATRRIITRLTKHCLSSGNIKSCQSSSAVQTLMEKEKVAGAPFVMYMTNIGIENTNPMYDILKDKQGLDHDEL